MIKRFIDIVFSVKTASVLVIFFAFIIGFATFIENDFGRQSAKAFIFNTWWFELVLLMLAITLVINLKRYNLFRRNKLPVLLFHIAFVVILLGAGVTRYFGFEGMMHIREGGSTNSIISDDVFLQIKVDDRKMQYTYDKKLFLSGITGNKFSIPIDFLEYKINIQYKNFLPNVYDTIIEESDGNQVVHLIVPGPDGMQSEYLLNKEQRRISNYIFTFNNPMIDAINLSTESGRLVCDAPASISSMKMADRSVITYNPNSNFYLVKKTLYSMKELNFVYYCSYN